MKNKAAAAYLRQVRSWLPDSLGVRRNALREFAGALDAYLAEAPDATEDQLREKFGTPQQIAASYVDNVETRRLLEDLMLRRRLLWIAFWAAFGALLLFLAAFGCTYVIVNFTNAVGEWSLW